jgi:glycosyltransferase involved in cell wall biosynthesis
MVCLFCGRSHYSLHRGRSTEPARQRLVAYLAHDSWGCLPPRNMRHDPAPSPAKGEGVFLWAAGIHEGTVIQVINPLVTVGIPTYNRPDGLSRTLASIVGQSYKNLQILVSDNCSTDPQVQEVIWQWARKDPRVVGFRQECNAGPIANFHFLLAKASGYYFMWAADDDVWEPFFVEGLVDTLRSGGQALVAAVYEAQYFTQWPKTLPFFPEGTPFYSFASDSPFARVRHMLRYSYGNLFYSLYRKEILDRFLSELAHNEIPFLLQVSSQGDWRVLQNVGFYKQTNMGTYRQARWEKMGGFLRPWLLNLWDSASAVDYHLKARKSIRSAILSLDLNTTSRKRLTTFSDRLLRRHLLELACGVKRANSHDWDM